MHVAELLNSTFHILLPIHKKFMSITDIIESHRLLSKHLFTMAAEPSKAAEPLSDSDSASDSQGDEGWDDVEGVDEEESQEVISLLDDRVFPDVISMLSHCKEKHSFDFLAVRQRLQLDFHGCVRLVNFSRSSPFIYHICLPPG
jgi:hypothetical protein